MNIMADVLRRILYPALVMTIVGTLWAMGTAQAAADEAYDRTYWPALHPELFVYPDTDPQKSPDAIVSLDDEM